jgi:hypothetical protein
MGFSGTNSGIAYFTGKPFYDANKKMIEVRDIDFDVKTKSLLLKSADWLFNKRIINEVTRCQNLIFRIISTLQKF